MNRRVLLLGGASACAVAIAAPSLASPSYRVGSRVTVSGYSDGWNGEYEITRIYMTDYEGVKNVMTAEIQELNTGVKRTWGLEGLKANHAGPQRLSVFTGERRW